MNRFKSKGKASAEGGFTLIEILVVVIMVAILMGIAAPSWFAYLSRQRMKAVQTDLAEVLKQSQADAKQLRTTQNVTIVTGSGIPTVTVNGVNKVLGGNNLKSGMISLAASSTPATISFNYQGRPTESGKIPFVVTVTPTGAAAKRCVVVSNLLGSVKTAQGTQCDGLTAASIGSDN